MKSAKGQAWTIDYIASFMIFMIASVLAIKILTNTFPPSEFEEISRESVTISQHILSQGVPQDWNPVTVLRIGLTSSNNRLQRGKLVNFQEINYNTSKTLFGIKHDYAFYLVTKNNSIVSIGNQCALGSEELLENKTSYQEIKPVAYYRKDDTLLAGEMTNIGADFYSGNDNVEVDNFYASLEDYELIVMENPLIQVGGTLTDTEKRNALEDYVSNGGILFLSENVSIGLTGVNFTITAETNAEVSNIVDPYWLLTLTRTIEDQDVLDASFTVNDENSTEFTVLADYDNTAEPFLARWRYGTGRLYFYGTVNALYRGGGDIPFDVKIDEAVQSIANVTTANCTNLQIVNLTTANIAKSERFAVYNSEMIRMVVLSWT